MKLSPLAPYFPQLLKEIGFTVGAEPSRLRRRPGKLFVIAEVPWPIAPVPMLMFTGRVLTGHDSSKRAPVSRPTETANFRCCRLIPALSAAAFAVRFVIRKCGDPEISPHDIDQTCDRSAARQSNDRTNVDNQELAQRNAHGEPYHGRETAISGKCVDIFWMYSRLSKAPRSRRRP